MRFMKRRTNGAGNGAVLERAASSKPIIDDFEGSDVELSREIERLASANRTNPDRRTERRLLALRHIAGVRALESAEPNVEFPTPEFDKLPPEGELPEFQAAELTPGLVRAAILRDGFILVRGLVDGDTSLAFGQKIDRAFEERQKLESGQPVAEGYYEEIVPGAPRFAELSAVRPWIQKGGGVLAADSPMLCAEMAEMFEQVGLLRLVEGYLGERPLISLQKTTLRKAEPSVPGAWHQDGSFMGDVRALNLWLSLSRCGDEAPGLDIVPRRLDYLVTRGGEEAVLSIQVTQADAEVAADGREIIRPIFEPGDAMLFDDLFLHQTGSDAAMPKPRYAIENWFFGPSVFPVEYDALALY